MEEGVYQNDLNNSVEPKSKNGWGKAISIILAIVVVIFIILIAIGRQGGDSSNGILNSKEKKEIRDYLGQEAPIMTAEEKDSVRKALAEEVILN